jgi:hypothetical protein
MITFFIILSVVFVMVGWWFFGGPWRCCPGAYDHKERETETPLEIVERRYAKGEIRKHQVRGTPTIVFVYSSTDIRKYSGGKDIKKGVSELRTALGRP